MPKVDITAVLKKCGNPLELFTLVEKLGEGSYGTVWKALHKASGELFAIKKVSFEDDFKDTMKEIEFMQQLDHARCVKYYGSVVHDNCLWIFMEYCGAGSVADIMAICDTVLGEPQIATLCRYVLEGLRYLHGIKKIHRDIKAGNVLLRNDGEGKLADFGVSGQVRDTMSKMNTVIGTPYWMAPEVIQEVGYSYKADIWSLGITVIELAEKKPPYANIHPMRAIFMIPSRPPPRLTEPEKWSKEMNAFVEACLMKNPDDRPSADRLLQHPFLQKAKGPTCLAELIQRSAELIQAAGGLASALGLDKEETASDGDVVETDMKGTKSGRIYHSSDEEESFVFGTMVTCPKSDSESDYDGDETMKRDKAAPANYRPSFLDHIQASPKAPQISDMSADQLTSMLSQLDGQLERDIADLKAKHAQQREDILAALKTAKK
mmetsp:Transcript_12559/g.31912  ORF Transcript_12559/g.31912 Transcript_12559/m.31912 type:complete len:434 (-) Transcript_12559:112-1413(-)|eukprot:CAMPEP_0177645602 /NCGR_PEP_ID=MMETSP0447-20121125/9336_1 /TAXON_ID=0 /ORGANISM="Stygamoeba regulata, Strain BSH-02190019" /LENGTH=433 /DNA_ID=CAMNT_0019148095 /DNA_START=92 /DNA_END=1393 /DNA_ORIENTATION=-